MCIYTHITFNPYKLLFLPRNFHPLDALLHPSPHIATSISCWGWRGGCARCLSNPASPQHRGVTEHDGAVCYSICSIKWTVLIGVHFLFWISGQVLKVSNFIFHFKTFEITVVPVCTICFIRKPPYLSPLNRCGSFWLRCSLFLWRRKWFKLPGDLTNSDSWTQLKVKNLNEMVKKGDRNDTFIPTTHKKYNRIMNSVTLSKPHVRKSLRRLYKRWND